MALPSIGSAGVEMRYLGKVTDITPFVSRFMWTESVIDGGWSWEVEFATEDWQDWVALMLGKKRDNWQLRLKVIEGDTENNPTEKTTDWRTAFVDGSAGRYQGEALIGKAWGVDKRLDLLSKARTRSWPGTSISDIVTATATEFGLAPDVQATNVARDRWQCRESDWAHLVRLSREATTGSGRGDVYVWIEEGALRFRAPDFQAPAVRNYDLSVVENRVDAMTVQYNGREVDRIGGATLIAVGYNLDTQTPLPFVHDVNAASVYPALGDHVPRDPADARRVIFTAEEDPKLVEAVCRSVWGRAGPRYYTMRLDLRPDFALRPGVMVQGQANLDARHSAPVFGIFCVLEVRHAIVRGKLTTTLACFRREAYDGDARPTGTPVAKGAGTDNYAIGAPDQPMTVVTAQIIG
jgi:hypothetical protein